MTQANELPNQNPTHKPISPGLFRWAGYGLLILTLLDLATILLPPQLMDPSWEFETMGALIERIPVPLLAIAFIFFGELQFRGKWERPLIKVLSWGTLVFGIFLLLLIPLGISNTLRLNSQNLTQIETQYSQQMEQLAQVEQRLDQATPEEMTSFLASQGVVLDETTTKTPKQEILSQLSTVKARIQIQADTEKNSRRNRLLERSIKWNLSALVSGFLFSYIWHLTHWARGSRRKRHKVANSPN